VNFANTQRVTDKEAPVAWPPAADDSAYAAASIERRRFWRARQSSVGRAAGGPDPLESLEAELVLLREENARLKASQSQRPELERLLGRARSLPAPEQRRDGVADEAAQMVVEALVIRESLVEICQQIERSMVVFEAKLDALQAATADRPSFEVSQEVTNGLNGADTELRLAPAGAEIAAANGAGSSDA
jgi:hypothetical protein